MHPTNFQQVIRRKRHNKAFTLTELMIVVAIIGLLAIIAIPNFIKVRKTALHTAFANDIRIACDAFVLRCAETGKYPPDRTPGQMPAGMEPYLAKMKWTKDTPIGGRWDWDNGQFGFKAGVSVYMPDATAEEMREIDKKIDDGDLGSGSFRSRSGGYISIIEH